MLKKFLCALGVLALGLGEAQAAIVGPLPYTLTNGTTADAGQVMANFNKIVNDVNTNVIFPSFSQQNYYAADSGSANAIVVTLSPAPTSYVAGMVVNAKIAANNTGATTINANGLGTQNAVNLNGSALKSQQVLAGMVAQFIYDGSQFQLNSLSPLGIRQAAVSRTSQIFTAPGAWTFTVPVGVYFVTLEAWGAGGGGGGSSGGGFFAGGGASGAYGKSLLTVNPGDIISGVLGTGGTGGTNAPTVGGAGGSTTVLLNAVLQGTATGGPGGLAAAGAGAFGGIGQNVAGTWAISMTGDSGVGGQTAGPSGGSSPRGGVGGKLVTGGCQTGGNPGGGGSGSTAAGCGGGNGWVYIEY